MSSSGDEEAKMEAVEVLKEEVLGKLRQADVMFLTGLCTETNVTIPPRKAKSKSGLINLMVTYLSSSTIEDSDDFGAQLLGELKDKLDGHLGTGTGDPVKVEPGKQVKGKLPVKSVGQTTQGGGSSSQKADLGNATVSAVQVDQGANGTTRLRADI